jgi:hypothetical protein
MPKKKVITEITTEEIISAKPKLPLVFISHDTKDADIAEAFSKLLSSVSTGVLKSFRSSDKRGTQGIEYGIEWFPEIMKKLNDASDIVCLLTQHSVDRPWILYEAGVAKGKLSANVLGVAIGIPLQKASNGPFAQFQNCSDDEESLTKLVLQLVKRIPNSEPDEDIIKSQVKSFKTKLTELTKKQPKAKEQTADEIKEDTSVAKLFEEVKIMFKDLPSRIDRHLDVDTIRQRRPRFHPMMAEELFHISSRTKSPELAFLMILGLLKPFYPWLYEIGIETYHSISKLKPGPERERMVIDFHDIIEFSTDHPLIREFSGRSEEAYMYSKDLKHFLHKALDRFAFDDKKRLK